MKLYKAAVLNPQNDLECHSYEDGAIVIDGQFIKAIGDYIQIKKQYPDCEEFDYQDKIILPAFFDMHFHWVQDDVREMPKDNLLQWLKNYTWPFEDKFKDESYSQKKAKSFFKKLIEVGTLGGAIYSSIHEHALEHAMQEVTGHFIIGDVLMNMNSPDYLTETQEQSLKKVKKFSEKYKNKYCLTPRFAPTTTHKVMKEGMALINKVDGFAQTHLCETQKEIDWVLDIYRKVDGFEDVKTYTDIYRRCDFLGAKVLMGHAIHLSDSEIELLKDTDTVLIHCPTSNAPVKDLGLGSGLFDFKRAEKNKLRWALGSDIGGGPFLSMFDVMKSFVEQNNCDEASYEKALYRATLAGAEILGVDKEMGNLNVGKQANFICIPKAQTLQEAIGKVSERKDFRHFVIETVYQGESLFSR